MAGMNAMLFGSGPVGGAAAAGQFFKDPKKEAAFRKFAAASPALAAVPVISGNVDESEEGFSFRARERRQTRLGVLERLRQQFDARSQAAPAGPSGPTGEVPGGPPTTPPESATGAGEIAPLGGAFRRRKQELVPQGAAAGSLLGVQRGGGRVSSRF